MSALTLSQRYLLSYWIFSEVAVSNGLSATIVTLVLYLCTFWRSHIGDTHPLKYLGQNNTKLKVHRFNTSSIFLIVYLCQHPSQPESGAKKGRWSKKQKSSQTDAPLMNVVINKVPEGTRVSDKKSPKSAAIEGKDNHDGSQNLSDYCKITVYYWFRYATSEKVKQESRYSWLRVKSG